MVACILGESTYMEVWADSQLLSDTRRMGFMRNMATRIKAGPLVQSWTAPIRDEWRRW